MWTVVLQRFSDDPEILTGLVRLHEAAALGAIEIMDELEGPFSKVTRAVWGTLYTEDAGIVSPSAHWLARVMV